MFVSTGLASWAVAPKKLSANLGIRIYADVRIGTIVVVARAFDEEAAHRHLLFRKLVRKRTMDIITSAFQESTTHGHFGRVMEIGTSRHVLTSA